MPFFLTVLLAIGGWFVARWLGWSVDGHGPGVVASVIGALILVTLYRLVIPRREFN